MDARTLSLVLNTISLAALACAVAAPVGTALAWLLTRTDLPLRRGLFYAFLLPLLVPLYLQAAAWMSGFGVQGWYSTLFGAAPWLQGMWGAAWVHGVAGAPWVMLIVAVGLRLVEPELEEQAVLDGSPWQVLWRVTLPAAWPAVGVACLWVAITTATEIAATDLFMVRTFAEEVYTGFALEPDPEAAVAALLPGAALTALLLGGGWWLCSWLMSPRRPLSLQRRWQFPLGRWRWPALAATGMLLALVLALPAASLLYKAGQQVVQQDDVRLRTWSAAKATEMVATAPWSHRREIGASVLIAGLGAISAVATAAPLAWWSRRGGARSLPAVVLAAVGLAVPGPVLGVTIIWLLNQPGSAALNYLYDRTIFAPWLVIVVRALPVAIVVLWHAFRTVPVELVEAATLEGAGPLRRLLYVGLPLRWPAMLAALLAALAVGLGELSASVMVLPPGVSTVAFRVFDLLHTGYEDRVAGLCLSLVLTFATLTALVVWLSQKHRSP